MKKFIFILLILISTSVVFAQTRFRTPSTNTSTSNNGVSSYMPSGAIIPFDLGGKCPNGWSIWNEGQGRFIVGTGQSEGAQYGNKQTGGVYEQSITADNIEKSKTEISGLALKIQEDKTAPYVMVADTSVVDRTCIDRERHCTRYPPRPYTIDLGVNDPKKLDNRPPFIALTYCRKN